MCVCVCVCVCVFNLCENFEVSFYTINNNIHVVRDVGYRDLLLVCVTILKIFIFLFDNYTMILISVLLKSVIIL